MPEVTDDQIFDTSERDGWYEPIRTNLEDVIRIYTDGEIPQVENTEPIIPRSSRNVN